MARFSPAQIEALNLAATAFRRANDNELRRYLNIDPGDVGLENYELVDRAVSSYTSSLYGKGGSQAEKMRAARTAGYMSEDWEQAKRKALTSVSE